MSNKSPKIYNVGTEEQDPPLGALPENCKWVVYEYIPGNYEGSGEAYAFANGKYWYVCLSHCSCYGAWENDDSGIPRDWEEIGDLEALKIYTNQTGPLWDKIKEIKGLK